MSSETWYTNMFSLDYLDTKCYKKRPESKFKKLGCVLFMNLTYKESVLCNFLNFVSMKNVLGIREM